MKILLQTMSNCNVFVDSDNLKDLDSLMDIVRTEVEHLVIYLTKDTLTRCWCAGEIATAVSTQLKMTAIATPSWSPPDPLQLGNLGGYLDLSTTNPLNFGISFEMIAGAYQKFRDGSIQTFHLPANGRGRVKFETMASLIGSKSWTPSPEPTPQQGMVIVSSSFDDDEATAASAILLSKISKDIVPYCPAGACMLADYEENTLDGAIAAIEEAHAVIVLLSRTSLSSLRQLETIVNGMASCGCVVPLVLPSFQFPSSSYYREVLPKVYTGDKDTAITYLEDFFRRIGIPFSINASDQTLGVQARTVLDRIATMHRSSLTQESRAATRMSSRMSHRPSRTAEGSQASQGAQDVSCGYPFISETSKVSVQACCPERVKL